MRIAFLALLAFLISQNPVFGQAQRLIVKSDPDGGSQYRCDIHYATFKTPKNWRPNHSDKNTYAILSSVDECFPRLTRMISIDIGKPAETTARLTAEIFAKEWNGKVLEESVEVDGETGYRVQAVPNGKDVRPIDCIIVFKDDSAFMIIGGAKEASALGEAMDELIATWKWKVR